VANDILLHGQMSTFKFSDNTCSLSNCLNGEYGKHFSNKTKNVNDKLQDHRKLANIQTLWVHSSAICSKNAAAKSLNNKQVATHHSPVSSH